MLRRLGILAVTAAACTAAPRAPRPPAPGMITGLIRDAASGGAIENATVELRGPDGLAPRHDRTDDNGAYMVPQLPPGRYAVAAFIGEHRIGERAAEVRPNEVTGLDFTVGSVEIDAPDLNTPGAPRLWRYRPRGADPVTATIEGTVSDLRQLRIAGAVVTVASSGTIIAEQTVTDDQGRFTIAALAPGTYDVVAYYAVMRRGQIEVRRNRVRVDGGEVVVVPFWLDTTDNR